MEHLTRTEVSVEFTGSVDIAFGLTPKSGNILAINNDLVLLYHYGENHIIMKLV